MAKVSLEELYLGAKRPVPMPDLALQVKQFVKPARSKQLSKAQRKAADEFAKGAASDFLLVELCNAVPERIEAALGDSNAVKRALKFHSDFIKTDAANCQRSHWKACAFELYHKLRHLRASSCDAFELKVQETFEAQENKVNAIEASLKAVEVKTGAKKKPASRPVKSLAECSSEERSHAAEIVLESICGSYARVESYMQSYTSRFQANRKGFVAFQAEGAAVIGGVSYTQLLPTKDGFAGGISIDFIASNAPGGGVALLDAVKATGPAFIVLKSVAPHDGRVADGMLWVTLPEGKKDLALRAVERALRQPDVYLCKRLSVAVINTHLKTKAAVDHRAAVVKAQLLEDAVKAEVKTTCDKAYETLQWYTDPARGFRHISDDVPEDLQRLGKVVGKKFLTATDFGALYRYRPSSGVCRLFWTRPQ